MISKIHIKNYKSILDATVELSPFTLLIGENGSGKSNFMDCLVALPRFGHTDFQNIKHFNGKDLAQSCSTEGRAGNPSVFSIHPANAGKAESLISSPMVHPDGNGTVQVLDALKTGDREDLFDTIESTLSAFIPDIEKLSFIPGNNYKKLQVREKHLAKPTPVHLLSEGTQLTLIILTILYQENPPSIICLEDIDRGLHPRLYGKIIDLCFELTSKDNAFQIIATTHNPYIVDHFKGHEEAVILVEKHNGNTEFTTLEKRIRDLEIGEDPLGELWYSGLVGGVPKND